MRSLAGRFGLFVFAVAVLALGSLAFGLARGHAAAATVTFRSPGTATVTAANGGYDHRLVVQSSFRPGENPDEVSLDVRIDLSLTNQTPVHEGGTCADAHGYSFGPSDPTPLPQAAVLPSWSPLGWNVVDFALPSPPPQQFGIDGISYRDSQSLVIRKCHNTPYNSGYDVVTTHTDTREFTGTFSVARLPAGCYVFDVVNSVFGYGEIDTTTVGGGFAAFCVSHQDLHLTKCATGAPLHFSSTDSINVSIGWASLTEEQLSHFLDVQNGTLSITDAGNATVFSDSWPTSDRSHWSWPPYPTTVYPNGVGSNGKQAMRIDFGDLVPPLSAGTYSLHARFNLVQGINDGFGAIPPGPWLTIDSCMFTVS